MLDRRLDRRAKAAARPARVPVPCFAQRTKAQGRWQAMVSVQKQPYGIVWSYLSTSTELKPR